MVFLCEARQEAGRGDRAGAFAADIGHIGEVAVQLLLVVIPKRQLPAAVATAFSGLEQIMDQWLVITHQAGGM